MEGIVGGFQEAPEIPTAVLQCSLRCSEEDGHQIGCLLAVCGAFAILGGSGETNFRELVGICFFLKVHRTEGERVLKTFLGSAVFLIC